MSHLQLGFLTLKMHPEHKDSFGKLKNRHIPNDTHFYFSFESMVRKFIYFIHKNTKLHKKYTEHSVSIRFKFKTFLIYCHIYPSER